MEVAKMTVHNQVFIPQNTKFQINW